MVVVIIRVDCCCFFQFDSVELRWMKKKGEIEKVPAVARNRKEEVLYW